MIRSLRLLAIGAIVLSMIGLGAVAGLLLFANDTWVPVEMPERLERVVGQHFYEMWLPGLIGGWLASMLLLVTLVLWAMFYVWRRRQYETLIGRLEKELASLRNLPFTHPAPLEDLPESPSPHAARIMHALDDEADAY